MPRVYLVPDKENKTNRTLIEFESGGLSEKTEGSWKTRFSNGEWVEVLPDSDHARICNEILRGSGGVTQRR